MNAVRERIWRAVRAGQPGFTPEDLAQACGCSLDEAEAYCAWLEAAGYIRPHGQGRFRATQAARGSLAAPSPDGQERISLDLVLDTASGEARLLRESTPGAWARVQKALAQPGQQFMRGIEPTSCRARVWVALREQRRATVLALAQAAGCAQGTAKEYVLLLVRAGCVKRSGQDGRHVIYELTSDPGPERPVIRETIRRKKRKST